MRVQLCLALAVIFSATCVLACRTKTSKLPEPTYLQPHLPPWTPPESQPDEVDPALLDGEWVEEEPPEISGKQQKVDLGVGGAQNSSTEPRRRATVPSPKSD